MSLEKPSASAHKRRRRLPSLVRMLLRQSLIAGLLIIVVTTLSISEIGKTRDLINTRLTELQKELLDTREQFVNHLALNNFVNEVKSDSLQFRYEFDLLTIDHERGLRFIAPLVPQIEQHHSKIALFSPKQQKILKNLKASIWTLEGIGYELLEATSVNDRLWLYNDSIDLIVVINNNILDINNTIKWQSDQLKQHIDQVIARSLEDRQKLEQLFRHHNQLTMTYSLGGFLLILGLFIHLFRRLGLRMKMLEQYAHDIAEHKFKRPPFSSKDITGKLAVRMGLMARSIRDGLIKIRETTRSIEALAYYDSLTGLENRRLFGINLDKAICNYNRYQEHYALLYLDLDLFKGINDSHGHDIGDLVLKTVADRLRDTLREGDSIARLGGDEFAILSRSPLADLPDMAQRILQGIQQPILEGELELKISVSIGIAMLDTNSKNSADLTRFADIALYKAKDEGRNSYHFYSEQLAQEALSKSTREKELSSAINNHQLILYYQPQFNLSNGCLSGVEPMLRWQHEAEGMMYSEEIISLAEQSGLIFQLCDWVIDQACHDVAKLNQSIPPITVGLNCSLQQLEDPGFLEKLINCCERHNLDKELVELVISESRIVEGSAFNIDSMEAIRAQGFKIVLDDFGAGYSSLSDLKMLPINRIKIDESFITVLPGDSKGSAIVDTTIQLAHRLNLTVVAEGIETEDQLSYLKHSHCDIGQGKLMASPQSFQQIFQLIDSQFYQSNHDSMQN